MYTVQLIDNRGTLLAAALPPFRPSASLTISVTGFFPWKTWLKIGGIY